MGQLLVKRIVENGVKRKEVNYRILENRVIVENNEVVTYGIGIDEYENEQLLYDEKIKDIFARLNEAEIFLNMISNNDVSPENLRGIVEDYMD